MYLIYDCEILNCIPAKDGTRLAPYQYCKGWGDYKGMGISCVGAIPEDGEPVVCRWDWVDDRLLFKELVSKASVVIGFNSRNFDDCLMSANGLEIKTDYDLLEEVRIAAYGSNSWQDQPQGYSYALGALGEANGFPKTGNGALAPQLWQQGKHGEVLDYCLNDVRITKALLELGLCGKLIDPNTGGRLQLPPLPR